MPIIDHLQSASLSRSNKMFRPGKGNADLAAGQNAVNRVDLVKKLRAELIITQEELPQGLLESAP